MRVVLVPSMSWEMFILFYYENMEGKHILVNALLFLELHIKSIPVVTLGRKIKV
jgi:hypothetical protein